MKRSGKVGTIQYTLLTSRANRRITIRVGSDGVLTIRSPYRLTQKTIEELITEHKDHLLKRIHEEQRDGHTFTEGDQFPYEGRMVSLSFDSAFGEGARVEGDSLLIRTSATSDVDHIITLIKNLYRKEAKRRITPLVEHWSKELGVKTPVFTIRDSTKRWGSCSAKGRLNFSLRSQALGFDELSYVVLHEVTHLIHFNHSKAFKETLHTHMPHYKAHQEAMFALQKASQLTR